MLKNDFDELEVGDWCFINDGEYIGIRLGKGETDCCILPIALKWRKDSEPRENTHYFSNDNKAAWEWNGNKEVPTLTPSILHWGNGRNQPSTWHGYLTDGKLVTV